MTTDGATPAADSNPTDTLFSADGQAVPFIDRNHYFALAYPVGWLVSELADSVGLILQAPLADEKWRARMRINVRACPRSQTLDRTLYLFRSDMLAKEGVRFEGQSFGNHDCGKPSGTLAWSMLRDSTPLRVMQWFIALRAGIIMQITASAEAGAFARHEPGFNLTANSIRPLKALDDLALLLPPPPSAKSETAAPATNASATSTAPAASKPVVSKPASPAPAAAAKQAPEIRATVKANIPVPTPRTKPAEAKAPEAPAARPERPVAQSVNPAAPAPAELESIGSDDAEESAAILASRSAPAPVPASNIDLSLETPEPAPASPTPTPAVTLAVAAKPAPAVQAAAPVSTTESEGEAEDDASNVTGVPAFTRLWVALDLAAKELVKDLRKEVKKHGLKPAGKALFEARTFALDSLRRAVELSPAANHAPGQELIVFLEAKVAGRTRLAKLTVTERCEEYGHACAATDASFPNAAALEAFAKHAAQGTGDHAALAAGLKDAEAAAVGNLRKRVAGLFASHAGTWQSLDAGSTDGELAKG